MLIVDVVYILMIQPVYDALGEPLVSVNFKGGVDVVVGLILLADPYFKLTTDVIQVGIRHYIHGRCAGTATWYSL